MFVFIFSETISSVLRSRTSISFEAWERGQCGTTNGKASLSRPKALTVDPSFICHYCIGKFCSIIKHKNANCYSEKGIVGSPFGFSRSQGRQVRIPWCEFGFVKTTRACRMPIDSLVRQSAWDVIESFCTCQRILCPYIGQASQSIRNRECDSGRIQFVRLWTKRSHSTWSESTCFRTARAMSVLEHDDLRCDILKCIKNMCYVVKNI